jgi:hypothetical protein
MKCLQFSKLLYKKNNFHYNLNFFPILQSTLLKNKKFSLCTLERLNVDKISMTKLNEKDKPFDVEIKEDKPFIKEDHIIEFNPQVKWEDEVLKSEIPVVVDCYAL